MANINFTPSTVFLTTFIMTLSKNDFGIEPLTKISTNILNYKKKVGLLKTGEALTESGRVSTYYYNT